MLMSPWLARSASTGPTGVPIGGPTGGRGTGRRFTHEELTALLPAAGFNVTAIHGIRVFADLVPGSLLDLEPGATAALVELEQGEIACRIDRYQSRPVGLTAFRGDDPDRDIVRIFRGEGHDMSVGDDPVGRHRKAAAMTEIDDLAFSDGRLDQVRVLG